MAFEQSDSTQIVVATFPSLEGGNIEDFSIRLADKWKIGQKGKDNGVILVIFPADRELRIEVGYGLEDKLTDAISSQIIRNEITPYFKKGQFDEGVTTGVAAIQTAVRGAYVGAGEKSDDQTSAGAKIFKVAAEIFKVIFYVIVFFLIIFLKSRGGSRYRSSGRSSSFWSGGGGGGFSSGGFSGGGGSFGGGGSSGRW